MLKGRALVYLAAALLYFVLPWDLDFVPLAGRIDDLFVLGLALWYAWKTMSPPRRHGGGGDSPGREPGRAKDAYETLGVERDAPDEEIKKAYRELQGKYHPDRLQHLGGEFRELASRKAVEINRAYEAIKRERGFT